MSNTGEIVRGAKGAAAHLGLSPRVIYHLVENGTLPAIRHGSALYFRKSELDAAFSIGNASAA